MFSATASAGTGKWCQAGTDPQKCPGGASSSCQPSSSSLRAGYYWMEWAVMGFNKSLSNLKWSTAPQGWVVCLSKWHLETLIKLTWLCTVTITRVVQSNEKFPQILSAKISLYSKEDSIISKTKGTAAFSPFLGPTRVWALWNVVILFLSDS